MDYVQYAFAGGTAYQYDDTGSFAYDQYASATPESVAHDQYAYDANYTQYEYADGDGAVTETAIYPDYSTDAGYVQEAGSGQTASYSAASGGGDAETIHVVRPGETLSGIAVETGTSVEHLASYNGVADPDLIYSGQVLFY